MRQCRHLKLTAEIIRLCFDVYLRLASNEPLASTWPVAVSSHEDYDAAMLARFVFPAIMTLLQDTRPKPWF